jgi:cytochrome c oxidase subunit I
MSTVHPDTETLTRLESGLLNPYVISALAVFVLMMLLGLIMRMGQGSWINVRPDIFYQLMTAHGAAWWARWGSLRAR